MPFIKSFTHFQVLFNLSYSYSIPSGEVYQAMLKWHGRRKQQEWMKWPLPVQLLLGRLLTLSLEALQPIPLLIISDTIQISFGNAYGIIVIINSKTCRSLLLFISVLCLVEEWLRCKGKHIHSWKMLYKRTKNIIIIKIKIISRKICLNRNCSFYVFLLLFLLMLVQFLKLLNLINFVFNSL